MQSLILVRGLPGSGKSMLADKLVPTMAQRHYEADQYFMVDGVYRFDITKIGKAHEWCQNKTKRSLCEGFSVVVSNTFTTARELQPYFDIAKSMGGVPQVILCQGQWGNTHNVPQDTLERMKARFEFQIEALYKQF